MSSSSSSTTTSSSSKRLRQQQKQDQQQQHGHRSIRDLAWKEFDSFLSGEVNIFVALKRARLMSINTSDCIYSYAQVNCPRYFSKYCSFSFFHNPISQISSKQASGIYFYYPDSKWSNPNFKEALISQMPSTY